MAENGAHSAGADDWRKPHAAGWQGCFLPHSRTRCDGSGVASVSASKVREWMVAHQREMGAGGGVVMEGRDIGTKVFPDADLKIFLDADPVVREQRRMAQQKIKGRGGGKRSCRTARTRSARSDAGGVSARRRGGCGRDQLDFDERGPGPRASREPGEKKKLVSRSFSRAVITDLLMSRPALSILRRFDVGFRNRQRLSRSCPEQVVRAASGAWRWPCGSRRHRVRC